MSEDENRVILNQKKIDLATILLQIQQDQKKFQLEMSQKLADLNTEQNAKMTDLQQRLEGRRNNLDSPTTVPPATATANLITEQPTRKIVYLAQQTTIPIFRGTDKIKHPMKFLEELEAYIKKLEIQPDQQMDIVHEALTDDAKDWSSLHKVSWHSFMDFRRDFINTYWSEQAQNKLRHNLATHRWNPSQRRSMEAHLAHNVALAQMMTDPLPEKTLIQQLMKHFPAQVQSLWALKKEDEKTLVNAAEFLRTQENIMVQFEPITSNFYNGVPPPKRFRVDHRNGQITNNTANTTTSSGNGRRSS